MYYLKVRLVALAALLALGAAAPPMLAAASSPAAQGAPLDAERVMASLNGALAWYRQVRLVMRSVNGVAGPLFTRDDDQMARQLLQRAFEAARAEAALIAQPQTAKPESDKADERARLEATVEQDTAAITALEHRLGAAPAAEAVAIARHLAAASMQLELDRVRLEFVTRLAEFDVPAASSDIDLAHQIQLLQDSVPELRSQAVTDAGTVAPGSLGTWALFSRLIALQRSRSSLDDLERSTTVLSRAVESDEQTVRAAVAPILPRLRALAKDPGGEGRSLSTDQQEFHDLLDRLKLLGAAVLPLRQETAILKRYASEVQSRQTAIDRQSLHLLQDLGVELIGVLIALVVILVAAMVWRILTMRYVTDVYRQRLLLNARKIVAVAAIALVLVFHFTSELAALVTALGFAAAGIAFALQNVILAVAGYFSIVAPRGIRVGDRVSLQGPFGYVHGEVSEIGLVRIKLNELAGDPPAPTGRVVVFPNSVVFTGSFIKHPGGPETAPRTPQRS